MKKDNKKEQKNKVSNNSLNKNSYSRKRAFFWVMVFAPYGLYRLYKHNLINRIATIFLTILIIFISILSIDTVLNPFRANNILALKSFNNFKSTHTELNLGEIRFFNRIGTKSICDNKYDEYEAITKLGIFDVLFGSENGKSYIVEGVYEKSPTRELIYVSDKSKDVVTDTFPEIINFLNENEDKFGKYDTLVEKIDESTEEIKTSKGIYKITLNNNQVSEVKKIEEDKEDIVYNEETEIKLIDKLQKLADKNIDKIGKVNKVVSYELYPNEQSQGVITDKGEFLLKYYDDGNYEIYKKN